MMQDEMYKEISILYARAGRALECKHLCNQVLNDISSIRQTLPKATPNWVDQRLEKIASDIRHFFETEV